MIFKKSFLSLMVGATVLSVGSVASAESINEKATDIIVNSDSLDSTAVLDLNITGLNRMITASSLNYHSEVNAKRTAITRSPYATGISSATDIIDSIYVKVRILNGDDTVVASGVSDEKNSSIASISVDNPSFYYGNNYVLGNHTFKNAGYQDHSAELRASW